MSDVVSTMRHFVDAVGSVLEGSNADAVGASPHYLAFEGMDQRLIETACGVAADHDADAVLALFDPGNVRAGPAKVGMSGVHEGMIRVQFGQLWLSPKGDQAVLVPRGVGRRFGHYAIERGRVVQRPGWPAADLRAGTARAQRRLTALVTKFAAVAPAVRA